MVIIDLESGVSEKSRYRKVNIDLEPTISEKSRYRKVIV